VTISLRNLRRRLDRLNNNEIRANTTDNNFVGVFVISSSSQNRHRGNTSLNNRSFDMEDGNANCDSNKWERNTFGTCNQSCIHRAAATGR